MADIASPTPPPLYDEEIDFQALAAQDKDFANTLDKNDGHVDFQDAESLQQLTKSLLKRDFNLNIELPADRLCPPVPVRYHYIRYISSLLRSTIAIPAPPAHTIHGLDVGTGASAIYALLAARKHPRWQMHGTDTDSYSLGYAQGNVNANNLSAQVHLHQVGPAAPLIDLSSLGLPSLDFIVCNPPFYSSIEEMHASLRGEDKDRPPNAVCTGAESEMVCEGGDAGFVMRMVHESTVLKERVRWYSSMLGKWSSVLAVVQAIKTVGCQNWAVGVLRAGRRTRRWVVAWSWGDWRPKNSLARGDVPSKQVLPPPTSITIAMTDGDREGAAWEINQTMKRLNLHWKWKEDMMAGLGFAKGNVWSRSYRRKQFQAKASPVETSDEGDVEDAALGVKITVKETEVEVRWLKGNDSVLFESFYGMLKRALRD